MPHLAVTARRDRFRELHAEGLFVLANAWDPGSARLLERAGAQAVASTSSGYALSLGRRDQGASADELVRHSAELVAATEVPVSIDAERCFGDDPAGVAEFARRLVQTGVAGFSIEDYDPVTGGVDELAAAVARVRAAAEVAREHGVVLTARAEAHLYGRADLRSTVERLLAFAEAGADVLYAPGLTDPDRIRFLVQSLAPHPVSVLLLPEGPTVRELADLGVRRASTGGSLASVAYAAAMDAARELYDGGSTRGRRLTKSELRALLGGPPDHG